MKVGSACPLLLLPLLLVPLVSSQSNTTGLVSSLTRVLAASQGPSKDGVRPNATPEEIADLARVIVNLERLSKTTEADNQELQDEVFSSILSSPFILRAMMTLNLADFQNKFGYSLLTLAARYGYTSIVDTMLQTGAYVDLVDEKGWTSLIWAARNNKTAVVRQLLQYSPDPNIRNRNHGDSALSWAAYNGVVAIVRDLLTAGAIVDLPSRSGNTALMLSAGGLGDRVKVLKLLIDRGADVNYLNDGGETALMKAGKVNHVEEVRLLLKAGADPDIRNVNYGDTVLGWASALGHAEVIRELVAAGADLNLKNDNGVTPLLLATVKNRIVAAQVLMAAGADINQSGINGDTPLIRAVFHQLNDMVLILLQHCPDLTLYNTNRKNVRQLAMQFTDPEIRQMISEHDLKLCLHENEIHLVGNVRFDSCRQVRCCHGNWTLTGVVLPSCGRSCRTVGSPAGVCTLAENCPTLVTEFQAANAGTDKDSLARFVRLYSCGFSRGQDLQVCCPTTSVPPVSAINPRLAGT